MSLAMWGLTIIALWIISGVLLFWAYQTGFKAGSLEGTATGLDLAWQRVVTADEGFLDDRRNRLEPQPLAIRYAMRTGGDDSSTPISGRLILNDMTRADWTKPASHKQIRARLLDSFPGCEVIGYAILDRCGSTEER
jgi:hypothetical protein